MKHAPATVELRDVSFSYPNAGQPALSHINLTLRAGEKLALIGLNGAGKTTLVKLICGFYQPSEGDILLNGIPQRDYCREDYFDLVSVLFQDACLLPVTLDENLTGSTQVDTKRLHAALDYAGFAERYDRLPHGGATMLVKDVNEGAAEFSGGERQKLLFARTLYKDSALIILDEPTAALDPLAEQSLYEHFVEAVRGRTVIYISHRLASTRFCDCIVLLQDGTLMEEGTHDSLMAAGGAYAQLFEVQSRYYREREQERERAQAFGDAYDEKEGVL